MLKNQTHDTQDGTSLIQYCWPAIERLYELLYQAVLQPQMQMKGTEDMILRLDEPGWVTLRLIRGQTAPYGGVQGFNSGRQSTALPWR